MQDPSAGRSRRPEGSLQAHRGREGVGWLDSDAQEGYSEGSNIRRCHCQAPPLPRVPANPRVRDGELRGIRAVWADPAPGFVRKLGRRGRDPARDRVAAGSFLPPPPDDPLPAGQVKGTLRVSLRDRCATPDMPIRSQDRQLSGSGRKTGQTLPAPGARLHGFTRAARRSAQAMILHVP